MQPLRTRRPRAAFRKALPEMPQTGGIGLGVEPLAVKAFAEQLTEPTRACADLDYPRVVAVGGTVLAELGSALIGHSQRADELRENLLE
jgi:hypothetical protein